MAEIADLYEQLRNDISDLAAGLDPDALETPVPATPGWNIRNIITHLTADATCVVADDFPRTFFEAIGDSSAVGELNDWTASQLAEREGRSLEELLQEWKTSGNEVAAMMRGERPWPEGAYKFADRVLFTDVAVHQQDIFGALGIERGHDAAPIRIGLRTYEVGVGWRTAAAGIAPLRFNLGDKSYTAGEGEPGATVLASGFELFRALSGRRNPDQIRAYEWDGDPEPYIPFFYPYGIREDALVE